MLKTHHPSEKELLLYLDGELDEGTARHVSRHLLACESCSAQLDEIKQASESFAAVQDQVLRPAWVSPPVDWPDASELMRRKQPRTGDRQIYWPALYAVAAAAATVVIAFLLTRHTSTEIRTAELLTRSSRLELPAHRQLRVRMGSRSLYRPALLSEADQGRNSHDQLSEVSQLFVSAGYSWKEPLSARSYSSWRRRLSHKRDQVTLINGQQPSESLYMIRTDTSEGLLRTASLAIRRNDLHPMEGSFQFVGAETVTISDTEVEMPETPIRPETSRSRNTSARQLSAADALHVLEALHRAGVDVGEDIEVLDNPTHTQFVLSASGIDALTRSAIQKDLKIHSQIPVIWEQPGARVKTTAAFASEALRSDHRMSPEIRGHLEQLLGGPDQLESVTNQSLDLAGELLASAHALYVLAQRVPYSAESTLSEPDRQLMGRLREDYLTAVANRFAELGRLLMPVIQTESIRADGDSPRQDWRKNTPILLQHAQNLNRDLAQLLAGSYTRPEGEALLQRIPATAASLKRSLDNPVGKAP